MTFGPHTSDLTKEYLQGYALPIGTSEDSAETRKGEKGQGQKGKMA